MVRTGCQWRQLPCEFPHYMTVQRYFCAQNHRGPAARTVFDAAKKIKGRSVMSHRHNRLVARSRSAPRRHARPRRCFARHRRIHDFFPWRRHLFATAPMPATSCLIRSPNSAIGRSKSCAAWSARSVLKSSRAAGSSNAHLPGSIVTAKDFEATIASAKAWLYLASVQLLIRRLVRPNSTYAILSRILSDAIAVSWRKGNRLGLRHGVRRDD